MKRYYVYYSDDWYEMGGVGLEQFDTEEEALNFIMERMRQHSEPELDNYDLIRGEYIKLVPATVVTSIKTERA